jgi:hypothetical protein
MDGYSHICLLIGKLRLCGSNEEYQLKSFTTHVQTGEKQAPAVHSFTGLTSTKLEAEGPGSIAGTYIF